jgi:PKD repeat protein
VPTHSAKYEIYYSGGFTEIAVNQALRLGGWYSLGSYTFVSGSMINLLDRTGEPYASTMVAFDAIKFTPIVPARTLTVSSAHDSPNPSDGAHSYSNGQSVTCSVSSPVTESGVVWRCTGWSGTGSVPSSGSSTVVTFTITQTSSITWNWVNEAKPVLTVYSAHDSPNPSVGSRTYDSGTSVTCSVTSPVVEGGVTYICTGWSGTGSVPSSGTGTSTTFTITQDSTITWIWPTPGPCTLSVSSAHDSPNPSNGAHQYQSGSPVTCSVSSPVVEGGITYTCSGWSGTGSVPSSGTGTSVTFTISQDSSITWNWQGRVIQPKLTVNSAHDSPSPPNGDNFYNLGQSVTCWVSSPVTEGDVTYACTGWSGTGSVPSSGSVTSVAFTITLASSITWNWIVTRAIYSLTIAATVGGTTSPSPGTYEYMTGQVASVIALQYNGYQLDYWELDTVNVGSNNPISVTMNAAHALRAVFTASLKRPIASFVYSPCALNPVVGEEAIFDASRSMGATFYVWDFGDGHSASTASSWTTHPYTMPGTYNVKLTAMNTNGLAETSRTVTVKKPPVLLVHGFHWDPWNLDDEWFLMKFGLSQLHFNVCISQYSPTDRGTSDHIQIYARKLANEVEAARQAYGVDKVDIVAHSMGGLVSRCYIEMLGGDKYVRKLIMLETPNHGIPSQLVTFAYPFRLGVGILHWASVDDFTAGSEFLRNLNANNDEISPNVQYEILGGKYYIDTFRVWWDLDSIGVPCQNIFPTVGHGDLIKNTDVISRIVYLLNDDPEPTILEEQIPPFQFGPTFAGNISPDGQQSFEIPISSTSEANFILTWPVGTLNLILNAPSGRLVEPYAVEIDLNVTHYSDEHMESYSIQNPETGIWKANIAAANITEEGQYTLMTLLNTTVTLTLDWQRSQYDIFESMLIRANLANGNESIMNASIDAKILKPDDTIETMVLYDDGLHNDNQTNDGIYANTFTNASLWGSYHITLAANGSLNNEQAALQAFASAWVEQYPDLLLNESDIHFSKTTVTQGETITVDATIHNVGETVANNASILFYDGDPFSATLIGETIINVVANGSEVASIQWNVRRGIHQISVVVNPCNEFLELNYTNNIASKAVEVTGHDITLLAMTTSKTVADQTYEIPIDVAVENQGDFLEDFSVTLYANATIIGKERVTSVPNGTWAILNFGWNISGFAKGNYTLTVYVEPLANEKVTSDNTLTSWILLTITGDLNGDFTVDIYDAVTLAGAYNSAPSSSNWNPNADINADGIVDIYDAIVLAGNFGKTVQ